MNIVKIVLIGGLILLFQSSKFLKMAGISVTPNIIFVYMLILTIYSELSFLMLIILSIFFGIFTDQLAGVEFVNSIIFPFMVTIIYLLKNKVLVFNLFIRILIVLSVLIMELLARYIFVYLSTGYFVFSASGLYYLLNNFIMFYLINLLREYLYEKKD